MGWTIGLLLRLLLETAELARLLPICLMRIPATITILLLLLLAILIISLRAVLLILSVLSKILLLLPIPPRVATLSAI